MEEERIYVVGGDTITEMLANRKLQVQIIREEQYVDRKRRKDRRLEICVEINWDQEEEET